MRSAPTLLAGYLLAALLPLLVQNPNATGVLIAVTHVAVAAGLARGGRSDAERVDFRAWAPVLLVAFLYAELPLLNQWLGPGYHDAVVRGWEAALFPSDPSSTWGGRMPWLPLSEAFHLGYLGYYPLIYLPFIALHLTRRIEGFHRGTLALMLAYVACYVAFITFPVQGPRYLNPAPPGIPSGPVRRFALAILESGSSRGTAFPSSHVSVAVTQALVVWRYFGRRVGAAVAVVALALSCGAVYGGFHYGVDACVGACVGVAAFVLSGIARRRRAEAPDGAASAPSA